MILSNEQKTIHREFRSYLRKELGIKGPQLDNYMHVSENQLSEIIRENYCPSLLTIYDEVLTIEKMVGIERLISNNDEFLAAPYGYISAKALAAYIKFYAQKHNVDPTKVVPEEFMTESYENEEEYIEGEESRGISKRYERNKKAREKCIRARGCKCYVCEMDFQSQYGSIGENYIQVHHIVPISRMGGAYRFNPVRDLVPLCANCHAMIHHEKGGCMDVEKLRGIYREIHGLPKE